MWTTEEATSGDYPNYGNNLNGKGGKRENGIGL